MKHTPKKVYIKEKSHYVELSYEEFCSRKATNKTYVDKLFLPIQGCLIETDLTHYTEYYRDREHHRYLQKQESAYHVISIEAINADDSFDAIPDEDAKVEEAAIHKIMLDKLRSALSTLSDDEQKLVNAIFFEGLSEREFSRISGIPQMTINNRKRRILTKLKKFLE